MLRLMQLSAKLPVTVATQTLVGPALQTEYLGIKFSLVDPMVDLRKDHAISLRGLLVELFGVRISRGRWLKSLYGSGRSRRWDEHFYN